MPRAQALSLAVSARANIGSMALYFAAEASRTQGNLWHSLPVIQAEDWTLALPRSFLLQAVVEHATNVLHKVKKQSYPDDASKDADAAVPNKEYLKTMLDTGGKYVFRASDAIVRLDNVGETLVKTTATATGSKAAKGKKTNKFAQAGLSAQSESLSSAEAGIVAESEAELALAEESLRDAEQEAVGARSGALRARFRSLVGMRGVDAITDGATILQEEAQFITFLCGGTNACPEGAQAKAALFDASALEKRLRVNTRAFKGLIRAYAELGVTWEKKRKDSNKPTIDASVAAGTPLFKAINDVRNPLKQFLETVRVTLAGELSRELHESRCFVERDGKEAIAKTCQPSFLASDASSEKSQKCSFPIPPIYEAGILGGGSRETFSWTTFKEHLVNANTLAIHLPSIA